MSQVYEGKFIYINSTMHVSIHPISKFVCVWGGGGFNQLVQNIFTSIF